MVNVHKEKYVWVKRVKMTAKEKRAAQNKLARQVEKRLNAAKLFKCGICQSKWASKQDLEAHVEHVH